MNGGYRFSSKEGLAKLGFFKRLLLYTSRYFH